MFILLARGAGLHPLRRAWSLVWGDFGRVPAKQAFVWPEAVRRIVVLISGGFDQRMEIHHDSRREEAPTRAAGGSIFRDVDSRWHSAVSLLFSPHE
jgi:hypothetical protein